MTAKPTEQTTTAEPVEARLGAVAFGVRIHRGNCVELALARTLSS